MINPSIKARWVKALRSGRYKQARGFLETSDGKNCCLGVLCRIMRIKKRSDKHYVIFDNDGISFPPHRLYEKIKVDRYGLLLRRFETLAEMNDGGEDFNHIADYIENSSI